MDERVKSMMLRKSILSVVLTIAMLMPLAQAVTVKAAADTKQIDVLFTHDTHSHLDSFSTIVNGEQKEVGGFAKIKTLINEKKKEDPDTLILDGGDFSMGTLIQTVYDTEAAELRMLGYLGYDADILSAYIPNYEVAKAFQSALKTGEWKDVAASISKCDTLLMATISGNTEKVAELIELAHDTYTSILKYNDENSLSCVLTMAYFTAPAYYTIIREMPAGKGFADFVFLPRANAGNRPAMIVELKYNQSADTVIRQIKEKRYQGALSGYESKILLVGISYDSEKHHTCSIEEW